MSRFALYPEQDPRELPAYTVAEAARFVDVPAATLRSWFAGRTYPRTDGVGSFEPVLAPADTRTVRLSFRNLVEAHVLRALRTRHGIRLKTVRDALKMAEEKLGIPDLLYRNKSLLVGGQNLFLERYGELLQLDVSEQIAMRRVLEVFLSRVDWDSRDLPIRLYPFLPRTDTSQRSIVIDPQVAFGRPILVGSGVSTSALVQRIDAGEAIDAVARDYDIAPHDVETAILFEKAA